MSGDCLTFSLFPSFLVWSAAGETESASEAVREICITIREISSPTAIRTKVTSLLLMQVEMLVEAEIEPKCYLEDQSMLTARSKLFWGHPD